MLIHILEGKISLPISGPISWIWSWFWFQKGKFVCFTLKFFLWASTSAPLKTIYSMGKYVCSTLKFNYFRKKKIAGGFVSEKLRIHSVLPTKKSAALESRLNWGLKLPALLSQTLPLRLASSEEATQDKFWNCFEFRLRIRPPLRKQPETSLNF